MMGGSGRRLRLKLRHTKTFPRQKLDLTRVMM